MICFMVENKDTTPFLLYAELWSISTSNWSGYVYYSSINIFHGDMHCIHVLICITMDGSTVHASKWAMDILRINQGSGPEVFHRPRHAT